jgi:hypothetical protein
MLRRFQLREMISFLKAFFLRCDVAGDQNNRAKPMVQVALEEQRDFVNDDLIASGAMFADPLLRQRANPRMDDGFKFLARRRVVKDDFPEFLTVDGSVRLEDFRAKGIDDFFPAFLIGLDDLAGQFIGIDDGRAEPPQDTGNGAFPRRDAAGQTDQLHGPVMAK